MFVIIIVGGMNAQIWGCMICHMFKMGNTFVTSIISLCLTTALTSIKYKPSRDMKWALIDLEQKRFWCETSPWGIHVSKVTHVWNEKCGRNFNNVIPLGQGEKDGWNARITWVKLKFAWVSLWMSESWWLQRVARAAGLTEVKEAGVVFGGIEGCLSRC